MIKKILPFIAIGILSGCAASNPFGVGYEHSACESSSKFGVCGSPEDIYVYKNKIKKVQNDYLKSGLDEELFFGITHDGRILVKEGRTDHWQDYERSDWKKEIEEKVYPEETISKSIQHISYSSKDSDIPVTENSDLSIKYKKQGTILQTRTNVGDMIRDTGLIQRVWVAPYVDKKDDLISAHELYVVVKKPKWIIGENNPRRIKHYSKIPTPISKNILEQQDKISEAQENIVQNYNINNVDQVRVDIDDFPTEKESMANGTLETIEKFIEEK